MSIGWAHNAHDLLESDSATGFGAGNAKSDTLQIDNGGYRGK
jgi:hypothetical protein